ncbi:MAG: tandem-95 repeat protein, partial [Rhodothermales bacterium]|nr:tandem-95 repeat protein [Rhodothermales bacterium]
MMKTWTRHTAFRLLVVAGTLGLGLVEVAVAQTVPTISAIADQVILEEGTTGALAFTVDDAETAAAALVVTAVSADQTLLPDGNLVLGGSGASRTITATPVADLNGGPVTVTVTVDDGTDTTDEVFTVTVTAVNDAPTFTASNPPSVAEDAPAQTLVGWVTAFDAGPADEDLSQSVVGYAVSGVSNGALFSSAPLVDASGTLTYTPAAGASGASTFDVTVQDDGGTANSGVDTSAPQTFTITVSSVNDPPTVANAIPDQLAFEDNPYSFAFAANTFDDADGDALTYVADLSDASPLPTWLSFDGLTRTFSGTPANDDVTILSVRVTASDPSTASISDIFLLTVQNTNDAPTVANPIPDQIAIQDQPFLFTFALDAFEDVDGDLLTYTALRHNDQPLPLWLTFDGSTRTFSGTPENADIGKLQVKVKAQDPSLASVDDIFDIDVSDVNDPPSFTSTPVTGATQGSPYSYVAAATDPDGNALTFSEASPLPAWLTLTDNGNGTATLSGTPANGDVGPNAVDLQVSDGALTDTQSFSITVANVNDPPSFTSTPVTDATEDSPYTYAVVATDPDGNALTFSEATPIPAWLTLTDNGNGTATLTGTPDNGDVGPNDVDLQVSDGTLTDTQSFTITVANVNDPPSFTSTPVTGATQGSLYSYLAAATDPDGNALTFSAATPLPSWLTLTDNENGTATLTGTPANGDVGPNDVDLQVSDGTLTDTQSFTITVADVNDPPSFTSTPVTGATQGSLYSYVATANDPDGDILTFSEASLLPTWLTLTNNGNGTATLSGTPANGDVGPNDVDLQVSDGALTDTQSFTITVADVNDPPSFTSTPVTGATQGSLYSYVTAATDPDADVLTFSEATPLPAWLTLTNNGNGTATLSGTPANGDVGPNAVDLQVSDGTLTDTQSFTITVANVNDPPVFTSTPVTGATQGTPYSYLAAATDPDGNALTFTEATPLPAWLTLTNNGNGTATLSGTPANGDVGPNDVDLQVSDGALTDTQSFTITVADVNDPPSFTSTP